MNECKSQNTTMVTRQVDQRSKRAKIVYKNSEHERELKRFPFREAIGVLMYLANATRPDIAYAVNLLANKHLKSTEDDSNEVKRIFRYLRGTSNIGIKFQSNLNNLKVSTDASLRDREESTFTQ